MTSDKRQITEASLRRAFVPDQSTYLPQLEILILTESGCQSTPATVKEQLSHGQYIRCVSANQQVINSTLYDGNNGYYGYCVVST